jgi:hypothetical protein
MSWMLCFVKLDRVNHIDINDFVEITLLTYRITIDLLGCCCLILRLVMG